MDTLIHELVHFADQAGYFGVYLYMLLVGTFIPVPSELMLIPSGYLASTGQKSFTLLLIAASLGSLSGALFNYVFALFIARRFLRKKRVLGKITRFFRRHGVISAFLAPLTPGLGQYISIPAGLSRMPLYLFLSLTFIANMIWVGFMLLIGFMFGTGAKSEKEASLFALILLGCVIVITSVYVFREIRRETKE